MKDECAGVYYILNLKNDRIYIGQSGRIRERFASHRNALRGDRHDSVLLQQDWKTFSEQAFEFGILSTGDPSFHSYYALTNQAERTFIHAYRSDDPRYGYNADQSTKSRKSRALIKQLDAETSERVIEVMLELNRTCGTALVLVTHDPEIARLSGRTIRLRNGEMVE